MGGECGVRERGGANIKDRTKKTKNKILKGGGGGGEKGRGK